MGLHHRCCRKKASSDCFYALTGRKRDTALSLGVENLEHENWMNRLLEKLKNFFDVNATDKAYEACVAFETCIRPDNVSVADFILDFESR